MPNIDTTQIEGFDSMTPEQQVAALLGVEIPEAVDLSGYVKKSVFDAKATEAATLSKQLRSRMSEQEAADADRAQAQAESEQRYSDLEIKYNELMRRTTIAEYKSRFLAQGYDDALAQSSAEALAAGDMEKVFANTEKYRKALEKKIKEGILDGTHKPAGAGGPKSEETDAGIEQARKIGKAKASSNQKTADVMKHYIG